MNNGRYQEEYIRQLESKLRQYRKLLISYRENSYEEEYSNLLEQFQQLQRQATEKEAIYNQMEENQQRLTESEKRYREQMEALSGEVLDLRRALDHMQKAIGNLQPPAESPNDPELILSKIETLHERLLDHIHSLFEENNALLSQLNVKLEAFQEAEQSNRRSRTKDLPRSRSLTFRELQNASRINSSAKDFHRNSAFTGVQMKKTTRVSTTDTTPAPRLKNPENDKDTSDPESKTAAPSSPPSKNINQSIPDQGTRLAGEQANSEKPVRKKSEPGGTPVLTKKLPSTDSQPPKKKQSGFSLFRRKDE